MNAENICLLNEILNSIYNTDKPNLNVTRGLTTEEIEECSTTKAQNNPDSDNQTTPIDPDIEIDEDTVILTSSNASRVSLRNIESSDNEDNPFVIADEPPPKRLRLADAVVINQKNKRIKVFEGDIACYCNQPPKFSMVKCELCKHLFHIDCVDLTQNDARKHRFKCSCCNPDEAYEIEHINGMRISKDGRKFLIKWKNYEKTTWANEDDLQESVTLLNEYLRAHGRKLSHLPEDTRVGSSNTNIVRDNWKDLPTIIETARSFIKQYGRNELEISTYTKLGYKTQIYILPYRNHAFVLLHIVEEERVILADGGNVYLTEPQTQQAINEKINCPIKALKFVQQQAENHCASSAALIAVEFTKDYTRNPNIEALTVCKNALKRTRIKFHKAPDTQMSTESNITAWPKFTCPKCNMFFRKKQPMIAHSKLCNV